MIEMKRVRQIVRVAVVVPFALAAPRLAVAASAQDSAAAQSLYDDARKLMTAHKWADACPKLEESQRLDPTQVTEFYLADCYEHAGRSASAWTTFLDLASAAHRAGRADREKVARDRAGALEPKLSKLAVDVPENVRVAGLVVTRDGEVLHEGQWGVPVAVDPGSHAIGASAPGKQKWTATEDVGAASVVVTAEVPALLDEPKPVATSSTAPSSPPAPEAESPPASAPTHPWRLAGAVAAGVGVAGLAVGGVFLSQALSKNSDANSGPCNTTTNVCTDPGLSLRHDAVSAGNVATVAFVAGAALVAGGAVLWFLPRSQPVQVGAAVVPGLASMSVRGVF